MTRYFPVVLFKTFESVDDILTELKGTPFKKEAIDQYVSVVLLVFLLVVSAIEC